MGKSKAFHRPTGSYSVPYKPVVSVIGTGKPEELAAAGAQVFQGEMMYCVMCGCVQRSVAIENTDWRAITLDGRTVYACPKEFPPEGASKEAFHAAYERVLRKALESRGPA